MDGELELFSHLKGTLVSETVESEDKELLEFIAAPDGEVAIVYNTASQQKLMLANLGEGLVKKHSLGLCSASVPVIRSGDDDTSSLGVIIASSNNKSYWEIVALEVGRKKHVMEYREFCYNGQDIDTDEVTELSLSKHGKYFKYLPYLVGAIGKDDGFLTFVEEIDENYVTIKTGTIKKK